MAICTRHLSLLSLALILAACSTIGTSGNTTPPATGASSAATTAGGHFIFRSISIHPQASSPETLINFVSDGPAQGGVPCIDCVNGASSSDNIGLTGPSSYIPTGDEWQYTLSFTDIAYKGTCKLDWTIASGKKVIDSFSVTLKLKSAGGFVLYGVDRGRPSYSGPATLTGKYACGKETGSAEAPLEFE
ncbi:MAG TPA: hypothetical protein VFF63_00755 [Candidatus Babeliales bacterium]|nr:hypothetical protein [Candidatus Babeliales bacterium]